MSSGEKITREDLRKYGFQSIRSSIKSLKDLITMIEDENHFGPINEAYASLINMLDMVTTTGRASLPSDIVSGFNEINAMFQAMNEDNKEEIFPITPLSSIAPSASEGGHYTTVDGSTGGGEGGSHDVAVDEFEANTPSGGLFGKISGLFGGSH